MFLKIHYRLPVNASKQDHTQTHCKIHKVINKSTYPTVTSNILLPTELETAISPKPFLATITEVIRSGMDVPAARTVKPITCKIERTKEDKI